MPVMPMILVRNDIEVRSRQSERAEGKQIFTITIFNTHSSYGSLSNQMAIPINIICRVQALSDPGCDDFGRRFQNRVPADPDITGEIGGSPSDNDAALEALIAFFTASQITSREKGFSRNSDIRSFSAFNAMTCGS